MNPRNLYEKAKRKVPAVIGGLALAAGLGGCASRPDPFIERDSPSAKGYDVQIRYWSSDPSEGAQIIIGNFSPKGRVLEERIFSDLHIPDVDMPYVEVRFIGEVPDSLAELGTPKNLKRILSEVGARHPTQRATQ